uniref:Lon N-terminal domain-containing protein n=1 Tax=Trieres chinensis TaxID=1514140 RepID=A0A7S2A921_TRICV|mmetsp:Transcript_6812/g.14277  ORF Transcript_6812/g.14277 Transcript_6812/m.14277 type:complete len:293 (+) Transcript_6812:396-1274(+)
MPTLKKRRHSPCSANSRPTNRTGPSTRASGARRRAAAAAAGDRGTKKPLALTASDLARLSEMRSRRTTMPIMILDAILPGQKLEFGSDDPKFLRLLEYALSGQDGSDEIGMIGLNPHTGRPLNFGSTLPVVRSSVHAHAGSDVVTLEATGRRRFEVQGEPWLDPTDSFYLADVEIVDDREEALTKEDKRRAMELSDEIPKLVEEWVEWVVKAGKCDMEGMERTIRDLGPMPENICDRSIWTAALVNPLPPLGVCLEVRPAMLACRNNLERVTLANMALHSSIDHISGKRRLF